MCPAAPGSISPDEKGVFQKMPAQGQMIYLFILIDLIDREGLQVNYGSMDVGQKHRPGEYNCSRIMVWDRTIG